MHGAGVESAVIRNLDNVGRAIFFHRDCVRAVPAITIQHSSIVCSANYLPFLSFLVQKGAGNRSKVSPFSLLLLVLILLSQLPCRLHHLSSFLVGSSGTTGRKTLIYAPPLHATVVMILILYFFFLDPLPISFNITEVASSASPDVLPSVTTAQLGRGGGGGTLLFLPFMALKMTTWFYNSIRIDESFR